MPFGRIFGALFFGGVCGFVAVGLLGQPSGAARLAGVFLGLLGPSLAIGLLAGRAWARWTGIVCATLAVVLSIRMPSASSGVLDLVLLFASFATAVLLAVPATGAFRGSPRQDRRRVGPLELVAGVGLVGLLTIGLTADRAASAPIAPGRGARSVASVSQRLRWTDFASGMAQARESGRPVLATFVTNWCPYCGKMDKQTWRSPAVAERLEGTILVKVDAEDTAVNGPELARKYGVSGYPVQLLLAPDGSVLARAGGYQSPGQLVSWLDSALDRTAFRNPTAANPSALR